MSARFGLRLAALALGSLAALTAQRASASGFSAARFGGEHGHPTTDNATALYYNPAGMALSKGTHIFVDGTLALRWASYDRPASAVDSDLTLDLAPGANTGKASLFNAIFAPFVGVTSDFGTDFIYGGLALYFPFGGTAVWDENAAFRGSEQFPGAVDGQQRWYSIDGTIRSMYLTGGLAFNIRKIGLSIGVTGSAIRSQIDTIRARNADSTDDLVVQVGDDLRLKEGRSHLDVAGWQGGFSAGLIYDIAKLGKYFLGLSYTSQPNVAGGMTLKGSLRNVLALSEPSTTEVELTQTLPDVLRFGVRLRPTDKVEVRLFGEWMRWSVFDKQCILDTTTAGRNCHFDNEDEALDNPEAYGSSGRNAGVVQNLTRFWRDAGGVRAGASYWFIPSVEGYAGLGYDSSAIPVETLDPALYDAQKMTVSLGVRWQIIRHLAMALTATEVIYFPVDTKGNSVLDDFQPPTRQPSGDGEYRQFMQLFNLYADISF